MMFHFFNLIFFSSISLSHEEYNQILRNLPEIIELHSTFVKMLEECHEKPSLEQRVGHIFISMVFIILLFKLYIYIFKSVALLTILFRRRK